MRAKLILCLYNSRISGEDLASKSTTRFLTSATNGHTVPFMIGFYDQMNGIPHESISFDPTY